MGTLSTINEVLAHTSTTLPTANSWHPATNYAATAYSVREGLELKTAIRQAITYCKTHDIMTDYFQKNESEVFDMVNFKWDQKRALEVAKEDGKYNAMKEVTLKLLKRGIPL